MVGPLKQEIEHWKFLDSWEGGMPWRSERHLQITLTTDASLYKWGAVVGDGRTYGDYWTDDVSGPIHIKEALALVNALKSLGQEIANHRVDAFVDNMAVVAAWQGQGSRTGDLAGLLKDLFQVTMTLNLDLKICYVPSRLNVADFTSRSLKKHDARLSEHHWGLVQGAFGPHTIDLMALDSNVMRDGNGQPLRHFTPFPTPSSSGVNVFSQDIVKEGNPYVFPPLTLIAPLLRYLAAQRVKGCTVVLPCICPIPFWWPYMRLHMVKIVQLARARESGVLFYPSKQGFVVDKKGLPWNLIRMNFDY